MGRIKGWKKVENDSYIMWSNPKTIPPQLGDVVTQIEFVKPKRNEIGYFYINKIKVNWVSGKAWSGTKSKDLLLTHPNTINEGVMMARKYMRENTNG